MSMVVGRALRLGMDRRWVYLEPEDWDALDAIAGLEGRTVDELCSAIDETRPRTVALGGTIRLFLTAYKAALGAGFSTSGRTAEDRWVH